MIRAAELVGLGRSAEAEPLARRIVAAHPESAEGWHLLGMALANLDRGDEAIAALTKAAALYTQSAEPLVTIGELRLLQGNRDAAEAAWAEALARDPNQWRATENLALLAERDANVAKAIQLYEEARADAPPDRLFPSLRLAKLHLDRGEGDVAVAILDTATAGDPDSPEAWAALGHVNAAIGRPKDAAKAFAKARSLAPDAPELYLLQARAEAESGELDAATATLTAAAVRFPRRTPIVLDLGKMLAAQGRFGDALTVYRNALDDTPDEVELSRGASFAAYRSNDLPAARSHAEKVANDPAATDRDRLWLASVQEAAGDIDAAIETYSTLVDNNRGGWIAQNNLAVLLTESDPFRAVELARKAAAQVPDEVQVADTLGWASFHADDLVTARTMFDKVLAAKPDDATANYRLGRILMAQGETVAGPDRLRRALQLDPDAPFADEAEGLLAEP
nr:tetratricopeptide repeat protein [Oceaniovalibus guishaninsula]